MDTLTIAELATRLHLTPVHTRRLIRSYGVPVVLSTHGWRVRPVDARILLTRTRNAR